MRRALAAGARLRTRHCVRSNSSTMPTGHVTALVCAGESGPRAREGRALTCWPPTAWARRACCCCRGPARFPDGLGNRSGLVGRNLMLHPYAKVEGLFDEPLGTWTSGQKAGTHLLRVSSRRGRSTTSCAASSCSSISVPQPVRAGAGRDDRRAPCRSARRITRNSSGASTGSQASASAPRTSPEPENRIALSDTLVDRDGAAGAQDDLPRLRELPAKPRLRHGPRGGGAARGRGGELFRTPLQARCRLPHHGHGPHGARS